MSDNSLVGKLRAMADKIDPQVDGIVVLIVGDVQIELGVTATGDSQFDATRLATALEQAVRARSAVPAGTPAGPVGDEAGSPYLSQLFR